MFERHEVREMLAVSLVPAQACECKAPRRRDGRPVTVAFHVGVLVNGFMRPGSLRTRRRPLGSAVACPPSWEADKRLSLEWPHLTVGSAASAASPLQPGLGCAA